MLGYVWLISKCRQHSRSSECSLQRVRDRTETSSCAFAQVSHCSCLRTLYHFWCNCIRIELGSLLLNRVRHQPMTTTSSHYAFTTKKVKFMSMTIGKLSAVGDNMWALFQHCSIRGAPCRTNELAELKAALDAQNFSKSAFHSALLAIYFFRVQVPLHERARAHLSHSQVLCRLCAFGCNSRIELLRLLRCAVVCRTRFFELECQACQLVSRCEVADVLCARGDGRRDTEETGAVRCVRL